jgi:hypothetical protein
MNLFCRYVLDVSLSPKHMIANEHHSCAPPEDTIGGLTGKDAPMPT